MDSVEWNHLISSFNWVAIHSDNRFLLLIKPAAMMITERPISHANNCRERCDGAPNRSGIRKQVDDKLTYSFHFLSDRPVNNQGALQQD